MQNMGNVVERHTAKQETRHEAYSGGFNISGEQTAPHTIALVGETREANTTRRRSTRARLLVVLKVVIANSCAFGILDHLREVWAAEQRWVGWPSMQVTTLGRVAFDAGNNAG
jgi:hypothetical protein